MGVVKDTQLFLFGFLRVLFLKLLLVQLSFQHLAGYLGLDADSGLGCSGRAICGGWSLRRCYLGNGMLYEALCGSLVDFYTF